MVTRHELLEDSALRACISDLIGLEYRGTTQVLNIVQFLDKYVMDKIAERIVKPLQKRLACYYGCLLVRPPKVLGFDRPEDPQSLDNLVRRIGATPVEWAFKTECCGAGFSVSRTDLVAKLSSQILHDAESRGAEAVVVACPMCHSNLDMRRKSIERQAKRKYDLPVLYITQAIGLALGLSPKKLGLHRHMVPVKWQSAAAAEAGRPPNRE